MRITANIIDDKVGEFEASITIVARCDCGGLLALTATFVSTTAVLPTRCTKCGADHALHVNIRGDK